MDRLDRQAKLQAAARTAGSAIDTHGTEQSIPPKYASSRPSPLKSLHHFKVTQFQSHLKGARGKKIQLWIPDNRGERELDNS